MKLHRLSSYCIACMRNLERREARIKFCRLAVAGFWPEVQWKTDLSCYSGFWNQFVTVAKLCNHSQMMLFIYNHIALNKPCFSRLILKKKRAPSSTAAGADSALSQVLAGTRRQVSPQTQAAVSSHPFQSRHSVRNPSAKSVTAAHKHTP